MIRRGLFDSAARKGWRQAGFAANTFADELAVVRSEIGDGALRDEGRAESLELRANEEYAQAIPRDQVLVDAFQTRFSDDPQAFAST